jgi:hypothetical protein
MEVAMRKSLAASAALASATLASATLGIVLALGAAPAMAQGYAFCIKGCDFGAGPGDCSFVSYQQCQASAAGRAAYCSSNPYFHGGVETIVRPNMSRRSY